MDTVESRLNHLRGLLKLPDLATLARQAGVEPGTARIQKSRNSISKDVAKKYKRLAARRGIELDLDWLLNSDGNEPVRRIDATDPDDALIDDVSDRRNLSVTVPELDVRAAMGGGSLVDNENTIAQWEIPSDLLRGHTTAPLDGIVVIRATGDSMAPEIPPGTRVMIDPSDTRPSPPGIFAVWDGIGLVIKRVEYIMNSDPPKIRLSSANPAYQTYERSLEEAVIRGRVIGRWAWV